MTRRIAILGNSGCGKSTLAQRWARDAGLPVLDLDTIHWVPGQIAVLRDREAALADLHAFCAQPGWIIEGCYGDLVAAALIHGPELVLLNPGEATCIAHCRARPWEPHKYASKAEQDQKLVFLLAWVRDYYLRDGPMSLHGHRSVFYAYAGPKREIAAPST
jgi:adenylate kinase family enzyme